MGGEESLHWCCVLQLPRAQFVCVAVCILCLLFVFWCRQEFVHFARPLASPLVAFVASIVFDVLYLVNVPDDEDLTWSVRSWSFNTDSMT
jgi:hypothetical protein